MADSLELLGHRAEVQDRVALYLEELELRYLMFSVDPA